MIKSPINMRQNLKTYNRIQYVTFRLVACLKKGMKNLEEDSNIKSRTHNIKMSELHLNQKNAFRKLYESGIQIDYRDPKIIALICQGVPSIYRTTVWPALIGNTHNITPKYYELLIKKAATYIASETTDVIPERSKIITQLNKIEHDIERTYPQLKIFRKDNEQGQSLFNILSAWTVFRQDVGYIQGMSQIAGLLLMELKEIQAFNIFCSIMTTDTLFTYQNMDLEQIQLFQHNFEKRLKKGDEALYFLLKQQGVQIRTYLFGWVMTLFTRTMSLDMVSLLWDVMLAYNLCSDILIEVSFFLIQTFKQKALKNNDQQSLAGMLKNFKLTDMQTYILICKVKQFY